MYCSTVTVSTGALLHRHRGIANGRAYCLLVALHSAAVAAAGVCSSAVHMRDSLCCHCHQQHPVAHAAGELKGGHHQGLWMALHLLATTAVVGSYMLMLGGMAVVGRACFALLCML